MTTAFRYLWYTDVLKDHGRETFDTGVLKRILPSDPVEDTLVNTLPFNKESLFECIVSKNYTEFQSLVNNSGGIVQILPTFNQPPEPALVGTLAPLEYDYMVFDREPLATLSKRIYEWLKDLDKPILCFTDTTRDGAQIIADWPVEGTQLYHAHTRELQNDPCDKMQPVSSYSGSNRNKFQERFYYETLEIPPAPFAVNTQTLVYPTFQNVNYGTLQDFYCNRVVELELALALKKAKNVSLTTNLNYLYVKPDGNTKRVNIDEDTNKAAKFFEVKEKILQKLGLRDSENNRRFAKESVFIGKHHGDVAQVLACFRPMTLRCFVDNTLEDTPQPIYIKSEECHTAFESYDNNACLKAMLEGVPIIFYHNSPPSGITQKIIVLKHQKFRSLEIKLRSEINRLIAKHPEILTRIARYNSKVVEINEFKNYFVTQLKEKKSNILRQLNDFQDRGVTTDDQKVAINNIYKDAIKSFVNFASAISYIPNIPNLNVNMEANDLPSVSPVYISTLNTTYGFMITSPYTQVNINAYLQIVAQVEKFVNQTDINIDIPKKPAGAGGEATYYIPEATLPTNLSVSGRTVTTKSQLDLINIYDPFTKRLAKLLDAQAIDTNLGQYLIHFIYVKFITRLILENVRGSAQPVNLASIFINILEQILDKIPTDITTKSQFNILLTRLPGFTIAAAEAVHSGGRVSIAPTTSPTFLANVDLRKTLGLSERQTLSNSQFEFKKPIDVKQKQYETAIYEEPMLKIVLTYPNTNNTIKLDIPLRFYTFYLEHDIKETALFLNFINNILSLKDTENIREDKLIDLNTIKSGVIISDKLILQYLDYIDSLYAKYNNNSKRVGGGKVRATKDRTLIRNAEAPFNRSLGRPQVLQLDSNIGSYTSPGIIDAHVICGIFRQIQLKVEAYERNIAVLPRSERSLARMLTLSLAFIRKGLNFACNENQDLTLMNPRELRIAYDKLNNKSIYYGIMIPTSGLNLGQPASERAVWFPAVAGRSLNGSMNINAGTHGGSRKKRLTRRFKKLQHKTRRLRGRKSH